MDSIGNEMAIARKEAHSIESLPEGSGQLTRIGDRNQGRRIYIYYRDEFGRYWFKNMIETERGIVSEYEAIFGRKERCRPQKQSIPKD